MDLSMQPCLKCVERNVVAWHRVSVSGSWRGNYYRFWRSLRPPITKGGSAPHNRPSAACLTYRPQFRIGLRPQAPVVEPQGDL